MEMRITAYSAPTTMAALAWAFFAASKEAGERQPPPERRARWNIVAVSAAAITIRTASGAIQRVYRRNRQWLQW